MLRRTRFKSLNLAGWLSLMDEGLESDSNVRIAARSFSMSAKSFTPFLDLILP